MTMQPDPTDRYLLNPLADVEQTQNMINQIIRRLEQLEAGAPPIPSAPPPVGTPNPDLIFTALSASPSSPNIGDSVTFTWTVANQGQDPVAAGTNIVVNLYIDGVAVTGGTYTGGLPASTGNQTWNSVSSVNAGGAWLATQGTHTIEARVNEAHTITEANTTNNNRVITLTTNTPVTGVPDLVVTALTTTPASPVQGQAVTFNFTVQNTGTGAIANGITVANNITVDGNVVGTASFASGLNTGASVNLTVSGWTATGGSHTVVATANATNSVAESNTTNNTMTTTVNVAGSAAGFDFVITALSASPSAPMPGDLVAFTVTVQNIGGQASPAGTAVGIGIYLDAAATPATWANFNTAIAAGASLTLDTVTSLYPGGNWTAVAGTHSVDAWVNDTNSVTETDNTNNHRTMTLTVAAPSVQGDVTDRGTTNAITAGTTIASGSFTPAATDLIVVVVEGTTI